MSVWRRIVAAFSVTLLLAIGGLGFWVADHNSRQIAFANATFTRLDASLSEEEFALIVGETRYRWIFSEPLKKAGQLLFLLLPPDVSAVLSVFETYADAENSPAA